MTVTPHDAHLPLRDPPPGGQPGVVGVQVLLLDHMLGHAWFDPIYEAACEPAWPSSVHQSGTEGCYTSSQTVAGGVPRSYGERHVVLTQVGAANIWTSSSAVRSSGSRPRVPFVEWGFSWLASLRAPGPRLGARPRRSAPGEAAAERVHHRALHASLPSRSTSRTRRASWSALFAIPDGSTRCCCSLRLPALRHRRHELHHQARMPHELRAPICYQNALSVFGDRILRSVRTPGHDVRVPA